MIWYSECKPDSCRSGSAPSVGGRNLTPDQDTELFLGEVHGAIIPPCQVDEREWPRRV